MLEPYDYLEEDLGTGDITSDALIGRVKARANIIAKEDCVLAGSEEASRIFEYSGLKMRHFSQDGQKVRKGTVVMEVFGDAKSLLKTERLALNFITRMSGIATITRELVEKCKPINSHVKIAATRKTTPGFRKYEKKAVIIGGGIPHRAGLHDQILIKDNHLRLVGSVKKAVKLARKSKVSKIVEVEVTDISGAEEAAKAGADIIMLDNMEPTVARRACKAIRKITPKAKIEVSGGITPTNVTKYADFADIISLGCLTHSPKSANFSLEIVEVSK